MTKVIVKISWLLFFFYVHHVCGSQGAQKKVSDSLGLNLQTVVSPMWIQGFGFKSSTRVIRVLF